MGLMVDIRRLSTFNKMAKEGANTVAEHLTQMTGFDTEMEITKINFIDVSDIERQLGSEVKVGTQFEFLTPPHGYVLVVFSAESARTLADVLLAGMGSGDDGLSFGDMERSAVQELGNIMVSGFIDGWANVLETTIDMSTPSFKHSSGEEMVRSLVESKDDEVALIFDSRIQAPGYDSEDPGSDVEVQIYAFPELDELVDMMNSLDI